MRVLIVGSTTKEYAFAKKISEMNNVSLVFVARGNNHTQDFATNIDINPANVEEILDFAMANEINLTIAFDKNAIENGIADVFNEANMMIFAPTKDASRIVTSKIVGKKFMYKSRINTPKFAVIDKEQVGIDYLKNARYPVVIKNDYDQTKETPTICTSFAQAKRILGLKFLAGNDKVIIEEFIEGKEYSVYFMTDGYNAVPICSCVPYKYSLENGGGVLTHGVGAYAPAQNLDSEALDFIRQDIIQPTLMELARNDNAYIGILGVDIVVDAYNNIYTLEFNLCFNEPDCEAILSLLKTDFIKLANAAIVGSLADDFEEIELDNKVAMSAVLYSPNFDKTNLNNPIIEGLSELDGDVEIVFDEAKKNEYLEYYTTGRRNLILTAKSITASKARQKLYDNVQMINYRGMKFIKDIGQFKIKE